MIKKILISFPEELIEKIDKKVESIGSGANRSGFIVDVLKVELNKK